MKQREKAACLPPILLTNDCVIVENADILENYTLIPSATRLIAITFLAGVIPVLFFVIMMSFFIHRFNLEANKAIQQGQEEQWQRSQAILNQMAEDQIRQKAFDVALQIELFLRANPEMRVKDLQENRYFADIAVQPVGKTGYTAVYDSETAVVGFHNSQALVHQDLHQLAELLPEFWAIIKEGMHGRYAQGYYPWKESDGSERQKYMYIVPVMDRTAEGVQFSVAATAYKDEFSRPIQAAKNVSEGTTYLLLKLARESTKSFHFFGYFFAGVSFLLILSLALWTGHYFSKAIDQLRRAMHDVNKGDFNIELTPVMSGDVGRLTEDFNRMVKYLAITTVKKERLERKESELEHYRDQLEQLVDERTEELTKANLLLSKEIDERKQAVEALQQSEEKLKAIVHAAPDGIILLLDRKLVWANDRMHQLLGYEKGTLLGKDAATFYANPEEYDKVGRELFHVDLTQEIPEVKTLIKRKDGSIFDCSIRAYPLDETDVSKGMIASVTDISESKKLETRLQQAQKMEALGTLAGGVAHDLNNILSGLVTYPELLIYDLPEESPMYKPLLTIKKSGDQAAAIVQDLLTMTRRGVAVFETVNLNTIIAEQLETPEFHQFKRHHPEVFIGTDFDKNLSNIKGSAPHLAKAVMNLVNNAAEAMSGGGSITITTENLRLESKVNGFETIEPGTYAVFSIKDEGSGIADADLPRIFEPFFTKKVMGRSGSGLGMAVIWGTVKDHSGYIDITTSYETGTRFTLYFPATEEELQVNRSQADLMQFAGSGEFVLVVDDSEEQREIARTILEKLDYRVDCVESGELAVEFLRSTDVDIVILDMIMGSGIGGLETYQQFSVFKPEQKIIIVSGFSESSEVKQLQRLCDCLYIKKPYTLEVIGEAVQRTLAAS